MNTPFRLVLAISLGLAFSANAQTSLERLLISVDQNNKTLLAARKYYQLEVISARTGVAPPDPQVEFGYLYGNPSAIGNRTDFAVSQSFDFPTAYIHNSRISNVKSDQALLRLQLAEQEIHTKARLLWIEQLYLNQKLQIVSSRLESAVLIMMQYQMKFDAGEVGKLQVNQIRLQVTSLRTKIELLQADIKQNRLALNQANCKPI